MALRDEKNNDTFPLGDVDHAKAWFIQFNAKCKVKKLQDHQAVTADSDNAGSDADYQKASYFLSCCGLPVVEKLIYLSQPNRINELAFVEIEKLLLGYLQPHKRLIWAERARFHGSLQQAEESTVNYLTRLRKLATECEFQKLKISTDIERDIIMAQLITGLKTRNLNLFNTFSKRMT
jgi:hypothetical protein